ncbi:type VII secretion protein EccCb [Mycobacterium tuberculosis]|uniref:type VII secretion protein EccCb n=1 Tax=Mycobacterium tuberculosis TaxID=1773 RepID=UPI00160359A2|nr:type VII secretion protein EccCb [Mycobacterium tuberculosis]
MNSGPACATADILVAPPPELRRSEPSSLLIRLLPVVMSVATVGVMVTVFLPGSPATRHPTFLAFPMMMLVSLVVTAVTGRGRRHVSGIHNDRVDYLGYLSVLRTSVTQTAAAQHVSLNWTHPDPATLWTLIGGPRMWERRPGAADFCRIRVGVGSAPLATRLVVGQLPPAQRADPVTRAALRCFLAAHATIADAPIAIPLRVGGPIAIDGDPTKVRGLLRAMICQLAVWHSPEELLIAGVVSDRNRAHWDWLKWLPHNQHPNACDALGPAPMVYSTLAEMQNALAATVLAHVVAIVDTAERGNGAITGVITIEVGARRDGAPPVVRCAGEVTALACPDQLEPQDALVCARRLAAHRVGHSGRTFIRGSGWAELVGIGDEEAPLVARMQDALAGEMSRRQQLLRMAGHLVSVTAYQRARQTGAQLPCLPILFIVVDEFSELLSQHPEFVDVFLAIGRVGRSLGMHLLLASQRLDEGRLRGLETHLSYRMCLKTWSASESRNVLGTQDAYQLPNTPGAGLLQTGTGELIRFQTAFVSGPLRRASPSAVHPVAPPSVRPFTTHAAAPVTAGPVGGTAEVPTPTVLHAVLDRLVGHGPAAHQVWLPPLDEPPMLGALLRDAEPAQAELAVPIGIVDRPFEQSRVPLTIDLSGAAGNVAVVGAPQTGKSTALRTLIMALAATHDAGRVQFYCLDFGGGALAQVDELPHVGAVAGRAQPQLASRMLAELESAVRFREAFFRDHGIDSVARYRQLRAKSAAESFADIFLVIDGWASLRQEFAALEESIVALAAQGLSFGVHVALSAARWAEIRPSLRDQIGSRIELRLADPADSELDRRQAQRVPVDRPGRGLSRDGMHMVIALPDLDGVALRRRSGDPVAPPIPLLPARVDYDSVVARAGDELGAHILLGLEERRGQPVAVDFGRHPHLLVLGDNECGKTAALRTLCREIVRTHTAARAQLLIVDFRHTLLDVIESEHMGGYVSSPAALGAKLSSLVDLLQARMPAPDVSQAQLRARSWWSGPDIYVVVDDYDLVAVSSGNPLMVLLEYLPHARDLGLHLVVARRSGGAARALFEPVLASLRDLGCRALLMSGRPDEGALFGSSRPMPLPPGRGILVTGAGDEQLVQVAWSPPP